MRRVLLALAAAAALSGCAAQPETVPGQAAPVLPATAASTASAPSPSSPARSVAPSTTPSGTARTGSPAQVPPPLPLRYETLTMTGFGAAISLPVPADWTRSDGSSAERKNTDLVPPDAPDLLLLRVDMTARGPGTAEDGARRVEAAVTRPAYHRESFTEVPGVGDDAVDWFFTYEQDGIRMWVCDRQILAGTAGIAVYLRVPSELRQRYDPLLQRVLGGLRITTS